MTEIALIWAQARDSSGRPVIGAAGDIPWRVREDLARFRALTSGHPVVMGRATWASLPRRPLPGRTNIVLTRTPGWSDDGATTARSLPEALELAATAPGGDLIWVIGGGQIYAAAMTADLAHRLEVTEIDLVIDGDAFAPAIDPTQWAQAAPADTAPGADADGWATSSSPGALRYRHRTYRLLSAAGARRPDESPAAQLVHLAEVGARPLGEDERQVRRAR